MPPENGLSLLTACDFGGISTWGKTHCGTEFLILLVSADWLDALLSCGHTPTCFFPAVL